MVNFETEPKKVDKVVEFLEKHAECIRCETGKENSK